MTILRPYVGMYVWALCMVLCLPTIVKGDEHRFTAIKKITFAPYPIPKNKEGVQEYDSSTDPPIIPNLAFTGQPPHPFTVTGLQTAVQVIRIEFAPSVNPGNLSTNFEPIPTDFTTIWFDTTKNADDYACYREGKCEEKPKRGPDECREDNTCTVLDVVFQKGSDPNEGLPSTYALNTDLPGGAPEDNPVPDPITYFLPIERAFNSLESWVPSPILFNPIRMCFTAHAVAKCPTPFLECKTIAESDDILSPHVPFGPYPLFPFNVGAPPPKPFDQRPFADTSIWNTPIGNDPMIFTGMCRPQP